MICFLNERSLQVYGDLRESLTFFLIAAHELQPATATLLKDSNFFFNPAFLGRFNNVGFPKDQRALIRELVFGARFYRCWRPDRHSEDHEDYSCAAPEVIFRDESVGEAAERQSGDNTAFLAVLSASESPFGNKERLVVTKISSGSAAELRNASSIGSIKTWIANQRGYYDPDSRSAPRDFQTVLEKAPGRFRSTGRSERRFSRQIYEEIDTGRLFYVDDGHSGHSAHLEVFSQHGDHLGIADIETGTLNTTELVPGRKLRL